MEFIDVIKKRTAVRKFSDKKVDKEIILKILDAGRIAPTAKNMQPEMIYVIASKEAIEKIDEVSPCRYNAPVVLLVCSNKDVSWHNDKYSTYEMDASIVATHLMLAATNYGVDNIWVEMFDKDKTKELFSLDNNIEPICLIPIGYKTDDYNVSINHNNRKELKEITAFL